jgi:hypothetical protein
MKAGTGHTFETDHERIAVAGCAPYFYLLDDMVKFKGHSQSFTCGWTAAARGERGVERLPGDDMSEEIVPHRSQFNPANLAKGLDPDQAASARSRCGRMAEALGAPSARRERGQTARTTLHNECHLLSCVNSRSRRE